MMFYKDDFAIDKVLRSGPSLERTILRIYTGNDISENEARSLWERIGDHKWYVSERLSRDVGFRVAAIDYVENFYEPDYEDSGVSRLSEFGRKLYEGAAKVARKYFEAKGSAMPL